MQMYKVVRHTTENDAIALSKILKVYLKSKQ